MRSSDVTLFNRHHTQVKCQLFKDIKINKKRSNGNIDDSDTDLVNWKMTKTITNSDRKSNVNQIPDLGLRSGGLDDSGDVTLTSLSAAASSPNIQKTKEKEFILYAGE